MTKATSLSDFIKNEEISLNKIFILVAKQLNLQYENLIKGNYSKILDFYTSRSLIIGKKIKVVSDPFEGNSEEIFEGVVERIGQNLELYFKDKVKPVTKGRLVL